MSFLVGMGEECLHVMSYLSVKVMILGVILFH